MLAIHLQIMGWISLILAALYPIYPKRFRWHQELQQVSMLTRQVFFVHCGFIILLLVMQGVLLAGFQEVLLQPNSAGLALTVGLLIFWIYRLIAQLFIYDRRLWQGNSLHTIVHVAFTGLWCYLSAVSGWALWFQTQDLLS